MDSKTELDELRKRLRQRGLIVAELPEGILPAKYTENTGTGGALGFHCFTDRPRPMRKATHTANFKNRLFFNFLKAVQMKFQQGQSGNPKGRPKGVKNRLTTELRATLKSIVEDELENLSESLAGLPPNERLAIVLKLLPYVLPRVQAVDMGQGEGLTDW